MTLRVRGDLPHMQTAHDPLKCAGASVRFLQFLQAWLCWSKSVKDLLYGSGVPYHMDVSPHSQSVTGPQVMLLLNLAARSPQLDGSVISH